tara:strand:+ start:1302 stop:2591 length:1290 start_codon:yes stop_codon:yes gene_type:complete
MDKKKVAIIGSGISGISSSLFLSKKYDVSLFEKNNYLGGHTRTKKIINKDYIHKIDTGFIVFNDQNYPYLVELFKFLNIETCNSNMSFSVSASNHIEYGSRSLNSLFAEKKNIYSIKFWLLLKDIFRLYNQCSNLFAKKKIANITLGEFLTLNKYSEDLKNLHIYPIVSSIWSSNKEKVQEFPLISFINFFCNHNLFNYLHRPKWKFVKGGSYKYINSIIKKNLFNFYLNKKVEKILRENNKIKLLFKNGEHFLADIIILATHADESLKLLQNPSTDEFNILSNFKYTKNFAYLHSDSNFMPKNKPAWSSWNFIDKFENNNFFSLTYWMNLLQNLKGNEDYFVTINPRTEPQKCYDKTIFYHPIYNLNTLNAQKKLGNIQGHKNTYYCGSYCGYGFHEDGIQSSAYIANILNVELPWKNYKNYYNRLEY